MRLVRTLCESDYWDNDISVHQTYNQDNENLQHLVVAVERAISNGEYSITEVPIGKISATQSWLSKFGGGDPVFPELRDPVLVHLVASGEYLILDGHHRISTSKRRGDKSVKAAVVHIT